MISTCSVYHAAFFRFAETISKSNHDLSVYLCEILQENQRKAQVYNNQALLMQHWFTHDNLISIQNYCLLSCRLYHVFFGVQGQWSKLLFLVSKFLQAFSIPHEATQLLLACLATQQATRDDRQAFFLKLKSNKGKDIHKINC